MKTVSSLADHSQGGEEQGGQEHGSLEHHGHDGPPPLDLPPREVLDTAGDLLRALAAPVRIAIVLQLRESRAASTNSSTRSRCRSRWSASTCASSSPPGSWPASAVGREVMYRLVDHHLADIVVAAVTHAAEGHE